MNSRALLVSIGLSLVLSTASASAQTAPTKQAPPANPTTAATAPAPTPAAPTPAPAGTPPTVVPTYWKTRAEKSDYHITSDYDETMRFCRQLEAGSNWVHVTSYGTSGQGRDLPLVILSKDRAFTPEQARAIGKPIVLIQNGIHSGEIEGKDACLALMRDMVILKTKDALLDHVTLLVLPIFSVDAHERRSPYNRINQNGPDEMGWRTTPIGLNLNRDYLKVEAPEMRALISHVYTQWWPHLLVDDHTTDGADFRHDVTYSFNHGPGTPAAIDRWLTQAFEGRVVPALQAMGHLTAPYLTFRRGGDPLSGFDFESFPPRFSTGYTPLQARPSILVETHMLKPYAARVRATYDLLVALLDEINARPGELIAAVAAAEAEVIARGREADPAKREVVLASHVTDKSEPFPFKGVAVHYETSDISGAPVPRYSTAPWDTMIPLYRTSEPTLTVRQPVGYLVPQEWTMCRDRLDIHGVRYRKFAKAWRDTVEFEHIVEWTWGARPSEGHRPVSVMKVEPVRRVREWKPGDLWVPLDQRSALVAVNLFEAQAPDGMTYWNYFDTVLENKEYGEDYVVEPLARKMLANNPALAQEFKARVAADTSFAHNPQARLDWFYRRSQWADPEQNLVPVARALRAPPEAVLAKE